MNKKTRYSVRDHILNTASELFYRQGYNNTGINQIIKEANVAKASLYTHFPSKEDLAVTYLRERRKKWLSMLKNFVLEGNSVKEKLERMFDFMGRRSREEKFRGCAFINIISEVRNNEEKISAEVKAHKMALLAIVKSIFEADGSYSPEDIEAKSKTVFLLFEGASVEAQIQREIWPVEIAKNAALKLV